MKRNAVTILLFLFSFSGFSVSPLRSNLLSAGSKNAALNIYNSYTSAQKAELWIDKLNQVIQLQIWNQNQLAILEDLKSQITPDLFIPGSQKGVNFNNWMLIWKKNALANFSKRQLRFICTLVSDYNPNFMPGSGVNDGQDCNCSKDSDWCGGTLFPSENCEGIACKKSQGCGTFWLHECDGVCQGAQPSGTNGQLMY